MNTYFPDNLLLVLLLNVHFSSKKQASFNFVAIIMCTDVSWTIKKAEYLRIDAFKLWCWRRLLRVHWTARRSNQSIIKEISPEYSLEELMLKLKLQYFWPPDAKNWFTGKDPDAGKDWGQEEKRVTEDEMIGWHHWLDGHEFEQALGDSGGLGSLASMGLQRVKHNLVTEQQRISFILWIDYRWINKALWI